MLKYLFCFGNFNPNVNFANHSKCIQNLTLTIISDVTDHETTPPLCNVTKRNDDV